MAAPRSSLLRVEGPGRPRARLRVRSAQGRMPSSRCRPLCAVSRGSWRSKGRMGGWRGSGSCRRTSRWVGEAGFRALLGGFLAAEPHRLTGTVFARPTCCAAINGRCTMCSGDRCRKSCAVCQRQAQGPTGVLPAPFRARTAGSGQGVRQPQAVHHHAVRHARGPGGQGLCWITVWFRSPP